MIKVNREREEIKSGKKSIEQSFYLSNETQKYQEICEAMRNHWGVETNNHLRDVTLKEDALRTKKTYKSSNDRNKNIGNKALSGNKM